MGALTMKFALTIALAALALTSAGTLPSKAKDALPSTQTIEDAWQQLVSPLSCDTECRGICCKSGGGNACVTACGCPANSCPKTANFHAASFWKSVEKATNGGCSKPGACGLGSSGCCFGAGHEGYACK